MKFLWRRAILLAALVALGGFFYLIMTVQVKEEEPLRVGVLTPFAKADKGWFHDACEGLTAAAADVGAEVYIEENVPDGPEGMAAVTRLHQKGVRLLLTAYFGYGDLFRQARQKYHDMTFYTIMPYQHDLNLRTYFVKLYDLRYLSGMLAGMKTKTGKIGFISMVKNPDNYCELNAFALGVRRTRPDAVVYAAWTQEMKNGEGAQALAERLLADGADVLANHLEDDAVSEVALAHGAYALDSYCYHEPTKGLLAQNCFDWQGVWSIIIRDHARNFNPEGFYWFDYQRAGLAFKTFADEVTLEEEMWLRQVEHEIKQGFEPFSGEVRDNEGRLRCRAGEYISDRALRQEMDWLVEGVVDYE